MAQLLRTGVVRRSPEDSGSPILIHGELLNNTGLAQSVHIIVVDIQQCPVAVLADFLVEVQAGCWQYFNVNLPGDLDHWEVRLFIPDDGILPTVYHFINDFRRDNSLTYRSTQFVRQPAGLPYPSRNSAPKEPHGGREELT